MNENRAKKNLESGPKKINQLERIPNEAKKGCFEPNDD